MLALGAGAALAVKHRLQRPYDLHGKVILITGGSRGLGLTLARQLARDGAKLALIARDEQELQLAQTELTATGVKPLTLVCDVTDSDDVLRTVRRVVDHYGRLDVLINNAGIIQVGPIDSMILADYKKAMDVNFWGALHFMLAVRDTMRGQRSGRIVNISSIGGKVAVPHLLPYITSKFALAGLSEGWRTELRKDGILVTTICPGLMRTGSAKHTDIKGRHLQEYRWFATLDNLPGLSVTPEHAARIIIDALRRGKGEVVIGLPYQALAVFHGLFPSQTSNIMALANRILPARGGIGTQSRKGRDSETPATLRMGTKRMAEVMHNQG